jgi:gamma-glutamylcyclotransferase (GGCT)/AIG2-like uncharacterized protein YtfP
MRVAVYGTLKSGFHNNYLLDGMHYIGKFKSCKPAVMYSRGGFPILSLESTDVATPITVEIYEVTEECLHNRLDRLEGFPDWYNRSEVMFHNDTMAGPVKAWIYHQDGTHNLPVVNNGNWEKKYY